MASVDYTNDAYVDADQFVVTPMVFLYDDQATDPDKKYFAFPNVKVVACEYFIENRPPECRFRYDFGDVFAEPGDPQKFEDVLKYEATKGQNLFLNDDRLVVRVYLPDGTFVLLFDGFAQIPQADVTGNDEVATFMAFGTPVREWDDPLQGAIYRDGDDLEQGFDTAIGDKVRFNPEGLANCTPDGFDHGSPARTEDEPLDLQYPVFADEHLTKNDPPPVMFTLGKAARYVMFSRERQGTKVTEYLNFYASSDYDAVLECRFGKPDPDGPIDPDDPTTYQDFPIEVDDLDVSRQRWPDALKTLIDPHGFYFRFYLDTDGNGDPAWWIAIERKDAGGPYRDVYMQAWGQNQTTTPLDVSQSNTEDLTITRDVNGVINEWEADCRLTRYEVGVVLAPGFEILAQDADDLDPITPDPTKGLAQWKRDNPAVVFNPVKYREYVADECGEGHWNFSLNNPPPPSVVVSGKDWTLDLDPVFGGQDPATGEFQWAVRRRPGEGHLLTLDEKGDRRVSELHILTDYNGPVPGIWGVDKDGNEIDYGSHRQITGGGWEPLDDRLGIRITLNDPNDWNICKAVNPDDGKPFPGGIVKAVKCLATPGIDDTVKRFYLAFVTTITSDKGVVAKANRRSASPTKFAVKRRTDNLGWFEKQVRDASSPYFANDPKKDVIRDDTADAKDHVNAYRKAHELGAVAGSFVVPWFSSAYQVGHRLRNIVGRGVSLRQNLDMGKLEVPVYPCVVSVRWVFDDQQQKTIVSYNDRRSDPPPERRRATGRH